MSTVQLNFSGSEINSLLTQVNTPTAPASGNTNMINSGQVFTAVNNLDVNNIAATTLVTESEGIGSNDNDTTIPTSAAVKDFVDTTVPTISRVLITPADITRTRVSGSAIQTNGLQDDGSYLSGTAGSNEVLGIFSYDIPTGYTATSLDIHGFRITATVYSNSIATDSATEIGAEAVINQDTQGSATIDITDTASSTATYITIKFKRSGGYTNKLTGAKLTLTKN